MNFCFECGRILVYDGDLCLDCYRRIFGNEKDGLRNKLKKELGVEK